MVLSYSLNFERDKFFSSGIHISMVTLFLIYNDYAMELLLSMISTLIESFPATVRMPYICEQFGRDVNQMDFFGEKANKMDNFLHMTIKLF